MKLLMISGDRSIAAGKTGAFFETLRELSSHFERIDILCPRIPTPQLVHVVHGNVYLHPASGSLVSQPSYILQKGRELFKEHHHDVMTVHDFPPFYNGIGARWLKHVTGLPAVLEMHHIVGWPQASSMTEWVGRWMTKLFIASHSRRFDSVRVVNTIVQSMLISYGVFPEKIHIVPSVYLDHDVIQAAQDQAKTFDMIFAARLVDNKGLMPIIDAVSRMTHATLLIIGDGPLKARAEAHVRFCGAENRVKFSGWIPDAVSYAKAVASGKIFLMNSKSEGNPRVAIEAMALGLPIIATKVGVMPDVVQDGVNGFFTDGTAQDIAAKATTLLSDPVTLARMGENAATVKNRFEKKASIKTYADFLKSFATTSSHSQT